MPTDLIELLLENQMLIYTVAMPLVLVAVLMLIWNELHKRGNLVEVKLSEKYRWNRCYVMEKQSIMY